MMRPGGFEIDTGAWWGYRDVIKVDVVLKAWGYEEVKGK